MFFYGKVKKNLTCDNDAYLFSTTGRSRDFVFSLEVVKEGVTLHSVLQLFPRLKMPKNKSCLRGTL